MVRRNARLIPTTEKIGLATTLWSDSEFKTLLGEQMDLIVTKKVRQELTQKYEIHPDKTWSVDECKKVLGASIRKNNVKGFICCHREFSVTLATQQSQRNSELEKQNNELCARLSTLTKKLNLKKAAANTDVEVSQPDNIYPDLQAFFETDVALQSVTDVPANSVYVPLDFLMGHMGELHGLLVLTSTPCVSKFSTISLIPCIASLLIRYCLVTGGGVPVNLTGSTPVNDPQSSLSLAQIG